MALEDDSLRSETSIDSSESNTDHPRPSSEELFTDTTKVDYYPTQYPYRTNTEPRSIRQTLSNILEAIRDDNEQTKLEESSRIDSNNFELMSNCPVVLSEDIRNMELTDEQQKIKDAGYSIEDILDPPPDGGWGWVCVGCSLACAFSCWGTNMCFGVYLNFYLNSNYFPGASKYDYALIGGFDMFLCQFFAPFVFLSMDSIGLRPTLIVGIIFIFLGNLLASFCTEIWQLYLCQGFLSGISFAFLFFASVSIIPSWFLHKRALANGIIMSGTGLGGLVFTLSVNAMMKRTGDQKWSLRMQAIVCLVVCSLATILIRERRPRNLERNWSKMLTKLKSLLDYRVIRYKSIIYITLWFTFATFGFVQMVFSLTAYATSIGLTASQGSSITAIMNLCQFVSRPLMGLYADKFGRINFTLFGTAYLGIIIFAFWLSVDTYAKLIGFAIMSGAMLGVVNVMNQPITADVVPPSQFPALFSFVNIVASPAALSAEVIALALRKENAPKPFLYTQIFGGVTFFAALVVLLPVREIKVKKLMMVRKESAEQKIKEEFDLQEHDILHRRILKYNYLLRDDFKTYWKRMFYPIRA